MRSGRLDRLITIQRKTVTQDAYGQETETWSTLLAREPASRRPLRGEERFSGSQVIAREQVEFAVRYQDVIANLNPLDRVIYPALQTGVSTADEPANNEIYDILDVPEIGRREGLRIIAARRPESAS